MTGRIASITLPTGGTILYAYSGGSNGSTGSCADGNRHADADDSRPAPGPTRIRTNGTQWATNITDPQSNLTAMSFQTNFETQRNVYQGSSSSATLLKQVDTCHDVPPLRAGEHGLVAVQHRERDHNPSRLHEAASRSACTYDSTYGLLREVRRILLGSGRSEH